MFAHIFEHFYNSAILLSVQQIEAIAGAMYTRQPVCRMLVFGCGNDSPLWFALNKKGRTVFLETSVAWINKVRSNASSLEICHYELPENVSVSSCLEADTLPEVNPPAVLFEEEWDVILIDGPPGFQPGQPGRALPIMWASQVRSSRTHVFLHDFQRPLEKLYGTKYLNITCQIEHDKAPAGLLGWSIGRLL